MVQEKMLFFVVHVQNLTFSKFMSVSKLKKKTVRKSNWDKWKALHVKKQSFT